MTGGYKIEQTKCPAYGQACKKCEKKNHFAKMCRASNKKMPQKMITVEQTEEGDEDEDMFIGTIEMKHIRAVENTK